ncbi:MAG: lamin tail domain-containing protein, partial [Patescibacteria group bacterium]
SEFKIEGGNQNEADDEFIELYNPTGQDISLDGWSIQYLGSGVEKFENIKKKNFEAEHKIPARGFFLIAKNNGYKDLIPPDMSHSSFSLSEDGGTIFLVASKEKMETPDAPSIIDKVAYLKNIQYANKVYYEGNPLIVNGGGYYYSFERKANENSTAASLRDAAADAFLGNSYDTDDNAEDFVLQLPTNPQNSASLPEPKDETWNIKLADSPWPTPFYDQKGSRKTKNLGFLQNPKIFWQADLVDNNIKTPAISQDNILYVTSQNFLSFLDPQTGQIQKQIKTTNEDKDFGIPFGPYLGSPASGPAIDNFGAAYFAFAGNSISGISAVTPEGKTRFLKQSNDRHPFSSPPLLGDSMIYFLPGGGGYWDGGGLIALYPDGTKKWEFK